LLEFILTYVPYLLAFAFLGLVAYDIVKKKPTRWFRTKLGFNRLFRVVFGMTLIVGMAAVICFVPNFNEWALTFGPWVALLFLGAYTVGVLILFIVMLAKVPRLRILPYTVVEETYMEEQDKRRIEFRQRFEVRVRSWFTDRSWLPKRLKKVS